MPKLLKLSDDGVARIAAKLAVDQLSETTSGYLALCEFRALWEHCGHHLDERSWAALADLCTLGAAGKAFAVREQLPFPKRNRRHKTPISRKE